MRRNSWHARWHSLRRSPSRSSPSRERAVRARRRHARAEPSSTGFGTSLPASTSSSPCAARSMPTGACRGWFSGALSSPIRGTPSNRTSSRSVEFTRTAPFTLTYHIRPEAHWSDGVEISAQDFVFTHRAIQKYFPLGKGGNLTFDRTMVRSVRALGPKTVRVVLRTRFAGWRNLFSNVLPRHALAGEDLTKIWVDRIDNPKTGRPIGSGPFLVGDWERGKQISLVRNPRYWGAHPPYLDRIVLRIYRPLEDLRNGEVDIAWPMLSPADLPQLPGYRRISRPGVAPQYFEIRAGPGGHPALKIKLVRRALAYGIDRVEIVRSLFEEIAPKLQPLDSSLFPDPESLLQAELEPLSLPPGRGEATSRAGRVPSRLRRHLRVRRRATLAPRPHHVRHPGA